MIVGAAFMPPAAFRDWVENQGKRTSDQGVLLCPVRIRAA